MLTGATLTDGQRSVRVHKADASVKDNFIRNDYVQQKSQRRITVTEGGVEVLANVTSVVIMFHLLHAFKENPA